jgi:hypothetical protein
VEVTSWKLWMLITKLPQPVLRPRKSWPVFRMISRIPFRLAKRTPARIWLVFVAITT